MLTLEFTRGLAAGCALCLAAYLLGRAHLRRRLHRWALHTVRRPDVTKRHPLWWATQVVFVVEIAGALVTRPRLTLRVWRHRHDPPPRSPAPVMDPDWAAKRRATTDTDTTETR